MDSTYQFYVKEDCTLLYEHQMKIERMYNVKLMLGEYVVGGGQWVGIQGDPGGRRNAKVSNFYSSVGSSLAYKYYTFLKVRNGPPIY